jgi:hypothetical protein
MWGWFVKGQYHDEIATRYHVSNVVPQHGYTYYLEETGLGGADDARHVFGSVISQATIDGHCNGKARPHRGFPWDVSFHSPVLASGRWQPIG